MKNNIKSSILVFITLVILQILYIIFNPDFNINFGAEYGRIAESLVSGEGYSNSYGESGPTAWFLPVLVLIIAGVFLISGTSVISFIILSGIKFLAYALSFYYISEALSMNSYKKNTKLLFCIFLLYFLFSPSQNFGMISDLWITVFLVSLFIFAYVKFYYSEPGKGFILLLITFFLAPLINPAFAIGFVVVTFFTSAYIVFCYFRKTHNTIKNTTIKNFPTLQKNHPKALIVKYLYFIGAFLLSIALWSTRNYIEFRQFMPSKSNMWFEFYSCNVIDSDGQLSFSTSYLVHPVVIEKMQREMKEMGEANWMNLYHEKSRDYLKINFDDYIQKVKYRLFNAFLFIENDMDKIESDNIQKFSSSDKLKLTDSKLLYEQGWISVFYSENQMSQILDKIEVQDKELIINDWKSAKLRYSQKKYSFSNVVRSTFMSIIPTICILISLLVAEIRKNPVFITSVVLYLFYLLPYILVSHMIRYQRPLFILQVIVFYLILLYSSQRFFPVLKIIRKKR